LLCCGSAQAGLIAFGGADPGAGAADPRPSSDAANTAFLNAVTHPGDTLHLITFEGLPLGGPSGDNIPITIAPGVHLSSNGLDHAPPPGFVFGLSDGPIDPKFGYNTTPGGSEFFQFAPKVGIGTATMTVSFPYQVQAIGLYLTGLGTANGDLHVMFNDGTPTDLAVTGMASGGVQYFSFIDPNKSFTSISFQLRGVTGTSRDVFGIDDVLLAVVPEPASALLLGMGVLGLLAPIGIRRLFRR
jgi:hypothetical protein